MSSIKDTCWSFLDDHTQARYDTSLRSISQDMDLELSITQSVLAALPFLGNICGYLRLKSVHSHRMFLDTRLLVTYHTIIGLGELLGFGAIILLAKILYYFLNQLIYLMTYLACSLVLQCCVSLLT
ncbi:hypothetical protein CP10139811_0179 [Chlamydia ibidis]|uniref:Transmembrane protein n=2 Tax=Chlamydia ibidis TaxID=1405396 RepID=S7J533_9CHLA|nr:hypothetical protein [Chlamydia ibidis]EPP35308.1 hypothetical protein CP10139811_0179 [Chlamydia ibidis]EQM62550.1 hypothetical protein H359_0622 [Chlamydia ibidis 10-1398/6]